MCFAFSLAVSQVPTRCCTTASVINTLVIQGCQSAVTLALFIPCFQQQSNRHQLSSDDDSDINDEFSDSADDYSDDFEDYSDDFEDDSDDDSPRKGFIDAPGTPQVPPQCV